MQNKRSTSRIFKSRRDNASIEEKSINILWRIFADAPKHSAAEYITEKIGASGANIIYDKNERRCIVVNQRRNNTPAVMQWCIGSIFSIIDNKLTLLSYMPHSPVKLIEGNVAKVTRMFDEYTVYPINDGTSLGLYWYNDEWVIRTFNGFDVGQFTWNGDKTYKTVFDEVMAEYPNFSLDKLNKNKCYTIGIKHTAFHPFKEGRESDIKKAWFIQSVDCSMVTAQDGSYEGAISKIEDIGIPIQMPIEKASMRSIMISVKNAYDNFIKTGEIFYGVILMSNTESIMIQSDLYEHIVNIFYINTLNKNIAAGNYDRQKYMALRVYLHDNRAMCDRFKKLFPVFNSTLNKFEAITDELTSSMIHRIEIKKNYIPADESKFPQRSEIFNNTVDSLLRQLSSHAGGLPKLDLNIARLLNRFIRSSLHIATLYDLMFYEDTTSQQPEALSLHKSENHIES